MPRLAKRQRAVPALAKSKRKLHVSRPFAPGYGLAEGQKGLLPWSWVTKQLRKCRTFWIATVHPEGRPHVMPVWGVWTDDTFYFSTGRTSRKGRNLAANSACTITNDNAEEAVIIEGSAQEVTDSIELKRMAAAYLKKYKIDPRSMKEPIFAVRPVTVFGFIEKTFPKT